MDLNSRHLIWREGRGISHAQGSEVSGRVDVVCICMSVCLPVTAVPPLTEYSTNGMHEGSEQRETSCKLILRVAFQ